MAISGVPVWRFLRELKTRSQQDNVLNGLLMVASVGFAVYVQNFARYSAVYGGIGAVIALMLWLYIAGLSLLIGSEINVLARRYAAERRAERA